MKVADREKTIKNLYLDMEEKDKLVTELCKGLEPMGIPAERVVVTFRSVTREEFAMNGKPLG